MSWRYCLFVAVAAVPTAWAAPVFDESVLGDFSGDGNAPTILAFEPGVNLVAGTMGRTPGMPVDADIFTFTIGPGQELTSIFIAELDPAESSFLAIAAGPSIRTTLTHPTENGSSHLSNRLTTSLGEQIGILAGRREFGGATSGLTSPAGPGTYTIWFQELSTRVDYQFSFVVVPEPGTIGLVGLALVAAAGWFLIRGRRRHG